MGLRLKLEINQTISYSDLIPFSNLGGEDIEEAIVYLETIDKNSNLESLLENTPSDLPYTRFALECLTSDICKSQPKQSLFREKLEVSQLISSICEQTPDELSDGVKAGFKTFKIKIGIDNAPTEITRLKNLCRRLPKNIRLRLDANSGLNFENARRFLGETSDLPIEYLEQPLEAASIIESIKLEEEFPGRVALDESVATTEKMIHAYKEGFRGIFAIKPVRILNLNDFLSFRENNPIKIVYSTAFESLAGSLMGLRLAASDKNNDYSVGYGVSHWLEPNDIALSAGANILLSEIDLSKLCFRS